MLTIGAYAGLLANISVRCGLKTKACCRRSFRLGISVSVKQGTYRVDICEAGYVPMPVSFLRSENPAVQDEAAGALWILSAGSQQNTDAILAAGAVPLLAALLGSNEPAL
ncbi:hypothetical protein ABBQ38_004837 [Trebouxia sp. C0009 RCD-2024]